MNPNDYLEVRVIPHSEKFKRLVKEYGDECYVNFSKNVIKHDRTKEALLATKNPVYQNGEHCHIWATVDDVTLEEKSTGNVIFGKKQVTEIFIDLSIVNGFVYRLFKKGNYIYFEIFHTYDFTQPTNKVYSFLDLNEQEFGKIPFEIISELMDLMRKNQL